jgi:hypothetical protein
LERQDDRLRGRCASIITAMIEAARNLNKSQNWNVSTNVGKKTPQGKVKLKSLLEPPHENRTHDAANGRTLPRSVANASKNRPM